MIIKIILQLLFIIVLILSGIRTSDYRMLEDLAFTNATSYDLVEVEEDGKKIQKLRIVNSIPEADPEASTHREVFEAVASTSKEARNMMARQSDRVLVSGQLRTVLFGLELAQTGIWKYIDTLIRDPSIGQRVRMIVVDGDAGDLLKQDYPAITNTGTFIFELLSKETDHNIIPDVNIYHFIRDYFDDGIDPVAPVLKQLPQTISVDGIALFQHDRYVGKITPDQALIFGILRKDIRDGDLSVTLHNDEYMMLNAIESKQKVRIERGPSDESFTVIFDLEVYGGLLEYVGTTKMQVGEDLSRLQRDIADDIEERAEKLIQQVQELGSDSLGIGRYVRNSLSAEEWYSMDWPSVYPNVTIRVNAHVVIKNTGNIQ